MPLHRQPTTLQLLFLVCFVFMLLACFGFESLWSTRYASNTLRPLFFMSFKYAKLFETGVYLILFISRNYIRFLSFLFKLVFAFFSLSLFSSSLQVTLVFLCHLKSLAFIAFWFLFLSSSLYRFRLSFAPLSGNPLHTRAISRLSMRFSLYSQAFRFLYITCCSYLIF